MVPERNGPCAIRKCAHHHKLVCARRWDPCLTLLRPMSPLEQLLPQSTLLRPTWPQSCIQLGLPLHLPLHQLHLAATLQLERALPHPQGALRHQLCLAIMLAQQPAPHLLSQLGPSLPMYLLLQKRSRPAKRLASSWRTPSAHCSST